MSLAVTGITMRRVWAMPNAETFSIPQIKTLLEREMGNGLGWADPFAGRSSWAEFRNDLSPDANAQWHMEARRWCAEVAPGLAPFKGVAFDPPYSPRQIAEVYRSVGLKVGTEETQNGRLYGEAKKLLAPLIGVGGLAICFGWNSAGFGNTLGFELEEILLVAHGGAHNDTIVTVERKTQADLFGAPPEPEGGAK